MKSMTTRLFGCVATAALLAAAAACGKSSPASPSKPNQQTAALAAPVTQSPKGGTQIQGLRPTLIVANSVATGDVGAVTYRFEVSETQDFPVGSRTVAKDGVVQGNGTTSWAEDVDLQPNFAYYWRARATNGTVTSGWSTVETFKTENVGFRDGQNIFDPLSNGKTVGAQGGGMFVPNLGWQPTSYGDFINYDIPTMSSGSFEFDVVGLDPDEPAGADGAYDTGLKFYCMGSGDAWDFWGFRDGDFKASLDKKSGRVYDGESGVVEHIFRVGDDDNREKTGENDWDDTTKYHVFLQWGNGHVVSKIGDMVIADETYGGEYAPANHRISLGCAPRTETDISLIFSNVRIQPR
jgi:hypothetical protein